MGKQTKKTSLWAVRMFLKTGEVLYFAKDSKQIAIDCAEESNRLIAKPGTYIYDVVPWPFSAAMHAIEIARKKERAKLWRTGIETPSEKCPMKTNCQANGCAGEC
jgi:hypothetical protein